MRGHEPQPRDRGRAVGGAQAVDRTDQLGEVRPAFAVLAAADGPGRVDVAESRLRIEVVAVAVDVLAQQRDLAVPGGRERPCLVHDLVERPAPLGAAAERDDAVRARLVAAVDDRQPGADRRVTRDGAARDGVGPRADEVGRVRDGCAVDDGRGRRRADRRLRRRQAEAIDELGLLVGPQEQVHRRVAASQPRAVRLPHGAACHHHPQAGVRGLHPVEGALAADDLRLGRFPDRAGVDDDEVGRVHRGRLGTAGGQQPPGHLLGVALVHLAAQRPDEERRQRAHLGPELVEALVSRVERRARAGGAGDRRREVEDGQGSGRHSGAMVVQGSCRPSTAVWGERTSASSRELSGRAPPGGPRPAPRASPARRSSPRTARSPRGSRSRRSPPAPATARPRPPPREPAP